MRRRGKRAIPNNWVQGRQHHAPAGVYKAFPFSLLLPTRELLRAAFNRGTQQRSSTRGDAPRRQAKCARQWRGKTFHEGIELRVAYHALRLHATESNHGIEPSITSFGQKHCKRRKALIKVPTNLPKKPTALYTNDGVRGLVSVLRFATW